MRAFFFKQKTAYDNLVIEWVDESNDPYDLTGNEWSFELTCFAFGQTAEFTKTTGITARVPTEADPSNLVVAWEAGELDALVPGRWIVKVSAEDGINNLELYGEIEIREQVPNRGYCEVSDLLLGGVLLPGGFNKTEWINSAADEIDSKLGQTYALPIDLSQADAFVGTLLKSINQFLASGRIVLDRAAPGEDSELHAYGRSLIRQAQQELDRIYYGSVVLTGVPKVEGGRGKAPSIKQRDTYSAVDAFEELVLRGGSPSTWLPGQVD